MNVLMSSINYDHMDTVFSKILGQIKPDYCAVTFLNLNSENEDRFPQTKALADLRFSYQKSCVADYREQPFYDEVPPLEPELVERMTPYERELLMMLARDKPLEYRLLWRVYGEHLRYWNYVLDRLKIDLFVAMVLPHESYDAVIYFLCRLKGIPVACVFPTNLEDYWCMFSTLDDPCPELRERLEELKAQYHGVPIKEIAFSDQRVENHYQRHVRQGDDLTPTFMKMFMARKKPESKLAGKFKMIRKRYKWWRYLGTHIPRFDLKTYLKIRQHFQFCKTFLEYDVLRDYYEKNCAPPLPDDRYIYVPLHMQPEFTTAPLGGIFADQALMVKMLSRYLPEGCFLYVKEHPGQRIHNQTFPVGRLAELYQDLTSLKNVKLMALDVDTFSLINGSLAVASVTGTAGFEALTRGKKFFMFGRHITQYAPGVTRILSNEDCRKAMETLTDNRPAASAKDVKLYFKALEDKAFYVGFWLTEYHLLSAEEIAESERNIIDSYVGKIKALTNR